MLGFPPTTQTVPVSTVTWVAQITHQAPHPKPTPFVGRDQGHASEVIPSGRVPPAQNVVPPASAVTPVAQVRRWDLSIF